MRQASKFSNKSRDPRLFSCFHFIGGAEQEFPSSTKSLVREQNKVSDEEDQARYFVLCAALLCVYQRELIRFCLIRPAGAERAHNVTEAAAAKAGNLAEWAPTQKPPHFPFSQLIQEKNRSPLFILLFFSERWLASHPPTHSQSLSLCSIKSSAALAAAFSPALCILFVYRRISCPARSSESQTSSPSSPCVCISSLCFECTARCSATKIKTEWSVRKVGKRLETYAPISKQNSKQIQ